MNILPRERTLKRFSRMSVQGQSSWFGDVRATSALPFIADVRGEDQQVRKVPYKTLDTGWHPA